MLREYLEGVIRDEVKHCAKQGQGDGNNHGRPVGSFESNLESEKDRHAKNQVDNDQQVETEEPVVLEPSEPSIADPDDQFGGDQAIWA